MVSETSSPLIGYSSHLKYGTITDQVNVAAAKDFYAVNREDNIAEPNQGERVWSILSSIPSSIGTLFSRIFSFLASLFSCWRQPEEDDTGKTFKREELEELSNPYTSL